MSGWFSWNFGKCRQESSTYATVTEGLSVTSIFKVSPLRQLDRVQWKEKKQQQQKNKTTTTTNMKTATILLTPLVLGGCGAEFDGPAW